MAKNFKNNVKGADKFFSVNDIPEIDTLNTENTLDTIAVQTTQDVLDISNTEDTLDMQDTQKVNKKKEYYRLNLKLDIELKEYITEAAWRERMTVTEYLNNLIRKDRERKSDV
jgi:hypothetical protein